MKTLKSIMLAAAATAVLFAFSSCAHTHSCCGTGGSCCKSATQCCGTGGACCKK